MGSENWPKWINKILSFSSARLTAKPVQSNSAKELCSLVINISMVEMAIFLYVTFYRTFKRLRSNQVEQRYRKQARSWVDLSYTIFADSLCRPTFLHEFEAKKLDVGEWQKWIELSLWLSFNKNRTRNWPQDKIGSWMVIFALN